MFTSGTYSVHYNSVVSGDMLLGKYFVFCWESVSDALDDDSRRRLRGADRCRCGVEGYGSVFYWKVVVKP